MITIAGSGVIGLTCAWALSRAGHAVSVLAENLPPDTTSDKAGALWFPFKAGPRDKCLAWAEASLAVYARQAAEPGWPVEETDTLVPSPIPLGEVPWQMSRLDSGRLRRARPEELPEGYAAGHVVRVPLIQTGPYLQRLMADLASAGVVIGRERFERLDDVPGDMVINCTGLGSRQLASDGEVHPVSGHIVKVRPRDPVRCILDEEGPRGLTYIFPRPDGCVLGGTAVDADWDTAVKPELAEAILERTALLEPGLADASVLDRYVGLRPWRPEVRLDTDRLRGGRIVVHNYGHGGSGWTLAWGCARDVLALVEREKSRRA